MPADDTFGLESVMYVIMTGEEPYRDLDEDDVETLFFDKKDAPSTDHLSCGYAIQSCWHRRFITAEQVVEVVQATICMVRSDAAS